MTRYKVTVEGTFAVLMDCGCSGPLEPRYDNSQVENWGDEIYSTTIIVEEQDLSKFLKSLPRGDVEVTVEEIQ